MIIRLVQMVVAAGFITGLWYVMDKLGDFETDYGLVFCVSAVGFYMGQEMK